jgi:hypothetical protein
MEEKNMDFAEYDFKKRERDFGRIVFALTLNRKKMTERVVIGESNAVRRHLKSGGEDVLYDRTRPLGQLLLDFESDPNREWNVNAMRLHESYSKTFPLESKRWEIADQAAAFLQAKYKSGEPSAMFAAIRTWEEYLNCYNLNHGAELFIDRVGLIYRPFFLHDNYKPWQKEAANTLSQAINDGESTVELWYPVKKCPFECVVAFSSFQPIIFYYLHKVEEWRYVFQACAVCNSHFLARSRHYEICSDKCRKVQAVKAKREFDERNKDSKLEKVHESAYYYWYNRLRKLKQAKNPDMDKVLAVTEAFKAFKRDTLLYKSMVKLGDIKLSDFATWIDSQNGIINGLMGE